MKVLIVDDSIVFRSAIRTVLESSGEVEKIDIAANGQIAVDKLKQQKFDAITLDMEMPVMDGTEAIKEIRKFNKSIVIIIFSAQNLNAVNKTLKALELGADDFVQKMQEGDDVNANLQNIKDELLPKLSALFKRRQDRIGPIGQEGSSPVQASTTNARRSKVDINLFKPELICIGSSTGGPDLLAKIFCRIKKLNIPVLLVQHMPPIFTTQLAKSLDKVSGLEVREAQQGDILKAGVCYLAPGDYHMRIKKVDNEHIVTLDQGEKVCYVRPAVDCLFESVAQEFPKRVASFILTGMGSDGAVGCTELKKKDNIVMIQNKETCVVWGMPGAVYAANAYDEVVNPDEVVSLINKMGCL